MNRLLCVLCGGFLLVTFTGCRQAGRSQATEEQAQRPSQPSPAVPTPSGARVGAEEAGWNVKLDLPAPVPSGQAVEMTARIFDGSGTPVEGAEVIGLLNMTSMDMGENRVRLTQKQPGVYAGKGNFSMAGPWEVILNITKDGKTYTSRFPISVASGAK